MSRQARIEQHLMTHLNPLFLQVDNESKNHHVPQGSETHMKVIVVSKLFEGKTRIVRHRLVNQLLSQELDTGLHALSMHLYTEKEWQGAQAVLSSPICRDGHKL
jgi:BolA protein